MSSCAYMHVCLSAGKGYHGKGGGGEGGKGYHGKGGGGGTFGASYCACILSCYSLSFLI